MAGFLCFLFGFVQKFGFNFENIAWQGSDFPWNYLDGARSPSRRLSHNFRPGGWRDNLLSKYTRRLTLTLSPYVRGRLKFLWLFIPSESCHFSPVWWPTRTFVSLHFVSGLCSLRWLLVKFPLELEKTWDNLGICTLLYVTKTRIEFFGGKDETITIEKEGVRASKINLMIRASRASTGTSLERF